MKMYIFLSIAITMGYLHFCDYLKKKYGYPTETFALFSSEVICTIKISQTRNHFALNGACHLKHCKNRACRNTNMNSLT